MGATGLKRHVRAEEMICRVCPQRPVAHTELRLCQRHLGRWTHYENASGGYADLAALRIVPVLTWSREHR